MRERIERGILLGWGVLSLTRERAQAIADELVERGEARKEEVRELADRLATRGEKERDALRKLIQEELAQILGKANLATKQDIKALEKKIDKVLKG